MAERFDAGQARELLQDQRFATLSTVMADGSPYGSLVAYSVSETGAPVLLISTLAWHTQHLEADGRASLLVTADTRGDRLAGARLTVVGTFHKFDVTAADRAAFLARHPEAVIYADFGDFSFWQMEPVQAHAIAGFGRIETFSGTDLLTPPHGAARRMT